VNGVVSGFGTIAIVIALGYALARAGVLGPETRNMLARLVFFVATPALLFDTLRKADPHRLLSTSLVVSAAAVATVAATYVVIARLAWRRSVGDATIGALASSYVNAANLGIPLAAFVLGDVSPIGPLLLLQLVIMAPVSFALLDASAAHRRPHPLKLLSVPLRNPITVGTVLGLILAFIGADLPTIVTAPIGLLGDMAVPAALLAYGVSLHGAPGIGAGGSLAEVVLVAALKVVGAPLAAWAIAKFALGLSGHALLAATMTAALPTAQNVFVYAVRYNRAIALARDSVFVTTLAAVPSILLIAALLG
jgi:predicted permease